MRKLLLSLLAIAVLGVFAAQSLAASRTAKIGDYWFVSQSRHTKTVHKGTRVVWRNTGHMRHDVKVTRGPVKFHSRALGHGGTFSKKLRKRGTYKLICTIHPWMKMTLRVKG